MRVIIAGTRTILDYKIVYEAIKKSGFQITEVISGGSKGPDRLGEQWAASKCLPLRVFKADWGKHGKMGGIIRNEKMAQCADALIAIWDGDSPGTFHMIKEAERVGLKVYVHTVPRAIPKGK